MVYFIPSHLKEGDYLFVMLQDDEDLFSFKYVEHSFTNIAPGPYAISISGGQPSPLPPPPPLHLLVFPLPLIVMGSRQAANLDVKV
jgi:hypothetical protein